jgi:hypothetical protein
LNIDELAGRGFSIFGLGSTVPFPSECNHVYANGESSIPPYDADGEVVQILV